MAVESPTPQGTSKKSRASRKSGKSITDKSRHGKSGKSGKSGSASRSRSASPSRSGRRRTGRSSCRRSGKSRTEKKDEANLKPPPMEDWKAEPAKAKSPDEQVPDAPMSPKKGAKSGKIPKTLDTDQAGGDVANTKNSPTPIDGHEPVLGDMPGEKRQKDAERGDIFMQRQTSTILSLGFEAVLCGSAIGTVALDKGAPFVWKAVVSVNAISVAVLAVVLIVVLWSNCHIREILLGTGQKQRTINNTGRVWLFFTHLARLAFASALLVQSPMLKSPNAYASAGLAALIVCLALLHVIFALCRKPTLPLAGNGDSKA